VGTISKESNMNDSIPVSPKINRWVWVLVIFGIVLTIFFGFRTVRTFAQVRLTGLQPGTTDVNAIRGWMTIPYLAKIYGVPQEYLYQQLNVPASGSNEKSLADLNKEFFSSQPGAALQKVKDAILAYKLTPTPQSSN
jgi:hypothetical protein